MFGTINTIPRQQQRWNRETKVKELARRAGVESGCRFRDRKRVREVKICFLNNHNATTAARISWRSVNSKSNHHPPGPNVQNRGYRLGQETHKIYMSRFRVIMDSATQVSGTLVPGLFIVATDNIWHFLATHSSLVGSGDGAKGGIWHEPMLLVPSCEPTCNLPTPSWRNVPIKRVLIVKPMWMLPWKQPTTKWQGNNVVSEGKSFL